MLLGLAACALVARAQSRAAETRALLVATLAVAPFLLVLLWLAADLPVMRARPLLATILLLVYLALLALRVLGAAFGVVRARALALAMLLLLGSPWVLATLNLDTRLWVADDTSEAQDEEDSAQTEVLFYDQPARIAAAVQRVRASQSGHTAAYFLGFAGDGDPAVFRREAQFASEVFSARYGLEGRSLLLINDVEDRDSYPLASVSGLSQALKGLTARMDPDNDVLVLYLTSHGSEDGLEVRNGSLPLAQIDPEDLRQALDESGIRWRVVVVSACYAGVFIDALKNETTAVVTASDAAHSSFGCRQDRDLTWFGEAFLKDSLPESESLEEAFARAARLIAQREDREHEAHSNPQLYVGALMRHKLEELESSHPAARGSPVIVRR